MADRLFWRVLGVFLVVGLFAVAYGLCKITPLPSPSLSSVAHADDSPPEAPKQPKTTKIILETKEGVGGLLYDLDESTVAEVKKILDGKASKPTPIYGIFGAVGPCTAGGPVVPGPCPVAGPYDTPNNPPSNVTDPYFSPGNSRYATTPPTNPPYAATPPNYSPYAITPPTSPPPVSYPPLTNPPVASYAPLLRPVPYSAPPSDMPKLEFKRLNSEGFLGRAKIPGGWLISTSMTITFYPDPEYKWNGGSIE